MVFTRAHTRTDDLDATVRRVINSLSFFAIIVANSICVLLFKLYKELEKLIRIGIKVVLQLSNLIDIHIFRKFVPPKL